MDCQNPEIKILDCQNPEFKILDRKIKRGTGADGDGGDSRWRRWRIEKVCVCIFKMQPLIINNGLYLNYVNKIDRPNTAPTVRAMCTFRFFRPFCRFTLVYEGHFVF